MKNWGDCEDALLIYEHFEVFSEHLKIQFWLHLVKTSLNRCVIYVLQPFNLPNFTTYKTFSTKLSSFCTVRYR